jgi:glycosyltransferase involved in cell wall biosynthesis
MKVLLLPSWYPTEASRFNGVFVREQALALQTAGVEVEILHVPGEAGPGRGLWQISEELDPQISAGIPTWRVTSRTIRVPGSRRLGFWLSYGLFLWSAVRGYRRIRSRGFKPDLINAHVYTAGMPAVVLGRLFKVPVVVSEHYTGFPRRTLGAGDVKRARYVFRRADRVLPVSNSLKQAIEAYGIEARFEIVPNAVDMALFRPREAAIAPARPAATKRLIFVGGLEPTEHKGFPALIEALKLLRVVRADWTLDVIGDGPSRPDYQARVERAGLASAVTFHGGLPKTEIAPMMRASDLFVLPSRFETQGVVLIEAMASGLPVVATAVGGIPEVVSPRDGILVPSDDPQALSDAMNQVLSNPVSYDARQIAARAAAGYSLQVVGARLAGIYADVLARR